MSSRSTLCFLFRSLLLVISFNIIFSSSLFSQKSEVNLNGLPIFSSYVNIFLQEDNSGNTISADRIRIFAKKQIGTAYGAGLLEQPKMEQLICRGDSTDCVLFVENTLAMAFASEKIDKNDAVNIADYILTEIEELRYRNASIDGYESRLHYFSDWIYEHALKNKVSARFELLFQDEELPTLDKPTFMSANRHLYPKLKSDDEMLAIIKKQEQWLAKNVSIKYIPEEQLPNYYNRLNDGDIFAFVSSVKGLDVSHTAIISKEKNVPLTFWHASTKNGVEQYGKGLQSYLIALKSVTGIVVLRVKD